MKSLLLTLLFAVASASGGEAVVTTLDGRTVKGQLDGWNAEEVSLQTAEGPATLAASELLDIRWSHDVAEAPSPLAIELIDGTRIAYASFTMADRQATVTGGHFEQPLHIPRELIKLVKMQPSTPAVDAALEEIERKDAAGDMLVVANRESQSMDYLPGVVGDITGEQAAFEWDGRHVPVKRGKIAAIVFYQAKARSQPEAVCELSLTDGSRIVAREASLEDGHVRAKTPAGVEFDLLLDKVVRADFSAGKVVYLSDLKPAEARWTPRVAAPPAASTIAAYGMPRNDVSYTGSPLSLLWKDDVARSRRDVRTYGKGLALRSRAELTYRLPEGMRRFVATAGIDPSSASQGHVVLELRGDDRVLWEGPIDGKQPPVEIDVELGTARRLQLTVDYGENLDYGDRLHLVEARVTK
jgi:hypothetical protein